MTDQTGLKTEECTFWRCCVVHDIQVLHFPLLRHEMTQRQCSYDKATVMRSYNLSGWTDVRFSYPTPTILLLYVHL